MGKMPLASLIGACSIGMLLTGCTGSRQNTNPAFAHGKADSGMGFTSHGQGPSQAGAPLADAARGNPSVSPPANPAGTAPDPLATGGSQIDNLSPYSGAGMGNRGASMGGGAGMGVSNPNMSGGMPSMGPAPSAMPSVSPSGPLGMNPATSGSSDRSLDPAGSPGLSDPMAGSGAPSASGFQRAGYSGNPGAGLQNAVHHMTDMDASLSSPSAPRTTSPGMLVPPTPSMPQTTTATPYPLPPSSSKTTTKPTTSSPGSTATDSTSLGPVPPLPSSPPSDPGPLGSPPPPVGGNPAASLPSMNPKTSTGAGGPLMMPDYLQQKPGTN